MSTDSLKIKGYDGFRGEARNNLSDLAGLVQRLEEEVERGSWSESALYKILRANLAGTAYTLAKDEKTWSDTLAVLFKAYATESAVAILDHEMRAARMRSGENAHVFFHRVARLFDLFGGKVSNTERARIVVDAIVQNEASYPREAKPLLLQLQLVSSGVAANKMEAIKDLLRNNAAPAVSMVRRSVATDEPRESRRAKDQGRQGQEVL